MQPYFTLLHKTLIRTGLSSPAAWFFLKPKLRLVTCLTNQNLLFNPYDAFFLIHGLITEEENLDGERQIYRFSTEEDILLMPKTRIVQFTALEKSMLLHLDRYNLIRLLRLHPEVYPLYEHFSAAWHQQIYLRMKCLTLAKKERFSTFKSHFPGLASRLMDKEVMCYLNISRSYFSKNK